MICLTFDTDHLDEARMREFLGDLPIPGRGTFFCTQRFSCLGHEHEQCPHAVLERGDWDTPLNAAREAFPSASGFRAHGCLHSHGLALELHRRGYAYASAQTEFGRALIEPFRETWGIWHLPIYYMDTLDLSHGRHWPQTTHTPFARELLDVALGGPGLYVFAFHPVHLMLNTRSPEAYLAHRDAFIAGAELDEIRSEERGVRDFYLDLVGLMEDEGVSSRSMAEALDDFVSSPSGFSLG